MHLPLFVHTCAQRSALGPLAAGEQIKRTADDIDGIRRTEPCRVRNHKIHPVIQGQLPDLGLLPMQQPITIDAGQKPEAVTAA
jgi:hypothetical protein